MIRTIALALAFAYAVNAVADPGASRGAIGRYNLTATCRSDHGRLGAAMELDANRRRGRAYPL